MSNYDKTIRSVTEVKVLTSHMTSLGKIMAASEDMQLCNFISSVVYALQYQFQHSTSKSTPTSLMFHPVPATVQLVDYCKYQNRLKKPEWQVIAESKGWIPPHRGI
jgi:hypothetical protein